MPTFLWIARSPMTFMLCKPVASFPARPSILVWLLCSTSQLITLLWHTHCFRASVFTVAFFLPHPLLCFIRVLLAPLSLSDLKLLAGPRVPSSGLFCVYIHLFGILALNISMLMIPNFIWPAPDLSLEFQALGCLTDTSINMLQTDLLYFPVSCTL